MCAHCPLLTSNWVDLCRRNIRRRHRLIIVNQFYYGKSFKSTILPNWSMTTTTDVQTNRLRAINVWNSAKRLNSMEIKKKWNSTRNLKFSMKVAVCSTVISCRLLDAGESSELSKWMSVYWWWCRCDASANCIKLWECLRWITFPAKYFVSSFDCQLSFYS